jgi:hypothetical protein
MAMATTVRGLIVPLSITIKSSGEFFRSPSSRMPDGPAKPVMPRVASGRDGMGGVGAEERRAEERREGEKGREE